MANEKKLDCVILGLLSHEDLTGYDIKQRMDTVLKLFWGASYGSIYPTLRGLVRDGLALDEEKRENGRQKITYTITEKGRQYLSQWLSQPVEKDEIRYETLLKLFFGEDIGPQGVLQHINHFEAKIQAEIPFLSSSVEVLEKIKQDAGAHLYYLLTAKFGLKIYTAYLEWCEETRQMLQNVPE